MGSKGVGLDIGTNMLVSAMMNGEGNPVYKRQRDAFLRITPKSKVNQKSIRMALENRKANFIIDEAGDFIVVGEDALIMANERNADARRPMSKGVLSPKEKDSLPMIKLIIKSLIGKGDGSNDLVFSIPAEPVDGEFDIFFHTEMMKSYMKEMGFEATPLNEGFAIAFSELLDDNLTGMCISCLVPGTKIYTDKGIVNIEDVVEGDKVLTHKGRFKDVNAIITKQFKGISTKIQLQGYKDSTEYYKFVDDHEVLVNRDGNWLWIGCESLKVGDIVGEPIVKQDRNSRKPTMTICERITSSNEYIKKQIYVGGNIQRLIGYFLGDGSICERDAGIQFDFNKEENDNINDVVSILKNNFEKNCTIVPHGDNCSRIKCYSKGLANWFRSHCYWNHEKNYPWDISKIDKSDCINLLAGLIRSDGNINNTSISFYNTSTKLIWLCKQLFSRIGIATSITFRPPRPHTLFDGRVIEGKKDEWLINSGGKELFESLSDIINNINCDNSKYTERLFINGDFCCTRVQSIEYEDYEGVVYDLNIEDDHSFSGPFLTIHNCGAGMINTAVVYEGDPVVQFSLLRGGDWIDNAVGKALDEIPSLIQVEKEDDSLDIINPESKIHEAISVYYNVLINYALDNILYELDKSKLPSFREEIPVVVSGGLTLAKGFVNKFKAGIIGKKFPFEVKEVRRAKDPMTAVANGCLMAAVL